MSNPDYYQIVAISIDADKIILGTILNLETATKAFKSYELCLKNHDKSTIFADDKWAVIELQAVQILKVD
jgi:hypothetical protein